MISQYISLQLNWSLGVQLWSEFPITLPPFQTVTIPNDPQPKNSWKQAEKMKTMITRYISLHLKEETEAAGTMINRSFDMIRSPDNLSSLPTG